MAKTDRELAIDYCGGVAGLDDEARGALFGRLHDGESVDAVMAAAPDGAAALREYRCFRKKAPTPCTGTRRA